MVWERQCAAVEGGDGDIILIRGMGWKGDGEGALVFANLNIDDFKKGP